MQTINDTVENGKKVRKSTKLFLSGVLILTITNIIVKAIGLLFKIPMNNSLGTTVMGYYNQSYTIYTLLYMISTAGLPIAVSRMISETRSRGLIEQSRRIYRAAMALFFVIGLAGMGIMLFGAKWYSTNVLSASNAASCIMMIAPTLFFICVSSAYRGYFQGYQLMFPTAVSQLLEAVCKLGVGLALAIYARNQGKADYIVAAYAAVGLTIGAALGMLFLMIFKKRFREEVYNAELLEVMPESDAVEPYKQIVKALLVIAIPITISASVMSFTNLIDSALISNLLQNVWNMTEEAATDLYGCYTTQAVSLCNLPPVLIYPISYSIIPLISMANSQGDTLRAKRVMESSLRVSVLIGLPCALGLAVLSEPILHLLFTNGVEMSAPLLSVLSPSTFFICVLSVTNAILQANGYERLPLVSMLCGAVVKITSSYLLIRFFGIIGTPLSTFLCYLTITAFNFFFVAKKVGLIPHFGRVFIRPFFASLVCAASAWGVFEVLNGILSLPAKIAVLLSIAVAACVYALFIFLIRAVTKEDVLLLPKGAHIARLLTRFKLLKSEKGACTENEIG